MKSLFPIDIRAPVACEKNRHTLAAIMKYIDTLSETSNVSISRRESTRLQPYFEEMSRCLRGSGTHFSARQLSDLFNDMAVRTHNTVLSEVMIVSSALKQVIDPLFCKHYYYEGNSFSFGFIQVLGQKRRDGKTEYFSNAFPVLTVPAKLACELTEFGGNHILRDLQKVMSFVNHDALHHMTSPAIISQVAANYARVDPSVQDWVNSLRGYEEWAHITQESIITGDPKSQRLRDIKDTVSSYFYRLGKVARHMQPMQRKNPGMTTAHEVVDFFGIVMGHALSRAFPLTHPIFAHYNACMDKALSATQAPPPKPAALVQRDWSRDPTLVGSVIRHYKQLGLDLAQGPRHARLLRLAELAAEDIAPHAPQLQQRGINGLQRQARNNLGDMVRAAHRTAHTEPVLVTKMNNL